MNSSLKIILSAILLFIVNIAVTAQERKVTPVETDDKKPEQPVWHYYDKHGNPLKEPVLFLMETDTVQKVNPGPVYPLLTSVNVGVNVFDAVAKAFGQSYANIDVWGNISLHNWFFPTLELGVGFGSKHPEDGNYHYKAKPAMYVKIGADYNFLYKNNPDYQTFVGLRCGFSSFGYDITGITIGSGYWGQTNTFDLKGQKATALYGQVLAGVKVKIWDRISLGWNVRYNFMFHKKNGTNSDPWFIPGFGANNRLTATFSVIYALPLCDINHYREANKNREAER